MGDDFRLQQILNNLVSNALKFTNTGGVTVEVKPASGPSQAPSGEVQFAVADTGIGISRKEQSRLFERFSQANSKTASQYGGSGLGLAIVRELVELYGGRISLESEAGKGSRFSFTLIMPQAQPSEKAQPPSLVGTNLQRLDGMHLLLAEDLPMNVLVVKRLLENQGATVAVAEDGQEAVDLAKERNFHLILMDMQMPTLDGHGAALAIRALGINTPIVALSADASSANRERAQAAVMVAFVAKPFNPEHLINEILQYGLGV
jgi:CheY-like chemotaxis protein